MELFRGGVSPHGNICHTKEITAQSPSRVVWPTMPVFVQEATVRVMRQQERGVSASRVPGPSATRGTSVLLRILACL